MKKYWKHILGGFLAAALLISTVTIPASPVHGAQTLRVGDLKVCSLTEPLGIDQNPVFSWVITGGEKDDEQSAYQIILADSREDAASGKGTVWDSGKVSSSDTLSVPYGGPALSDCTAYYWKVTVWSRKSGMTTSEVSRFSTGFLNSTWEGKWIGYPQTNCEIGLSGANWIWCRNGASFSGASASTQYFRFSFTPAAEKTVERFTLAYTADDNASVYLNGTEVGTIDTWSDGSYYTGTDLLISGTNTVAIRATNASVGYAGLVASMKITYTDGSSDSYITDNSWKVCETEKDGWTDPDYDDSGWSAPDQTVSFGSSPWGTGVTLKAAGSRSAVLLRKEFTVDKTVREAYAYICGLGFFDLTFNGKPVDDSVLNPFITQYDATVYYRTFDVTALLQSGENAIGVELGNSYYNEIGGVWNWQNAAWRDDPKLIFRLDIRYEDGTVGTILSDTDWLTTRDGPIVANSMYYGDVYDARRELPGFNCAGFDDSAWENAVEMAAPTGELKAQMKAPIKRVASFKPESIVKLGEGSWRVQSPEMVSGWVLLTGINGQAGDKITLTYGQKLDEDGSVHKYGSSDGELSGWYPHAYFQQDIYYCSGSQNESYEPKFSYKGFEYVQIDGFYGELTADNIVIYRVSNDVEVISEFESSNAMFNRLHESMRVAMTDNFQGEHCDPMLEKNGWLGDANVSLTSMMFTFDMAACLPGFIEVMEDGQEIYGMVPQMVPAANWGIANTAVWNTIFVYGVADLKNYFGTDFYTEEQYDAMRTFALRDIREIKQNGWVWFDDQLGDWVSPIGGTNPNVGYNENSSEGSGIVGTAFVYGMLDAMAEFADELGKPDDAAEYRSAMASIYEAFNDKFYNADKQIYETTVWNQIGTRTKYRQTSNLVPLAFGLVPEESVSGVVENLVKDIREKGYHLDTGCVGTRYILPVLCDNGYADVAYRIATQTTYPSWGYWLESDSKSTWEMWEATTRSFDHYFLGTYEEWYYTYLAGIRDVRDGYKTFVISPEIIGDLEYVKTSVQTVRGELVSNWTRNENGSVTMQITVPFGSTSEIYFPTAKLDGVTLDGITVTAAADGIRSVELKDGRLCITVGSGSYEFTSASDLTTVYRTALEDAVVRAEDYLDDPGYESANAMLTEAITAAKAVLNDENATQKQVNEATDALESTMITVVGSDSRIALRNLISECKRMRLEPYYQKDAWRTFAMALEEAEQTVGNFDCDDVVLDRAYDTLASADAQLDSAAYPNLALGKKPSASSNIESEWGWSLTNVTDGDRKNESPQVGEYAGYSSSSSAESDHSEWLIIDLGESQPVNHVVIYPSATLVNDQRLCYGFPDSLTVDLSTDGKNWHTVYSQEDIPLPEYGPQSIAFFTEEARYVRINALSLRPKLSDYNSYRLQLSEVEVYNLPSETGSGKTALETLIAIAEELKNGDEYAATTETVRTDFNRALDTAKGVLMDDDASSEEITCAFSDLMDAIHRLSIRSDAKSELEELIKKAEALNLSEYMDDGKDAFKQALENARTVLADADATESEIADAADALQKAMDGLNPIAVNPPSTGSQTLLFSIITAALSGIAAFFFIRRRRRIKG
ncbi:MAG: family 78 glycoside hydrolase catalytic domain [Eubacteriales bacterium]